MAKFKFRFDSVKKVKETFEKKAQKELAQIDLHIEQNEEHKSKLVNEVNSLQKPGDHKKSTISELKFISQYKNTLVKKIEDKESEISKLKIRRQEKVNEVTQKSKEKKILDKLEEAHQAKFNAVENRNELKNFDDLAVQKFLRSKK